MSGGPSFDRPVFIVAAPRSGSTLLFEALARAETLWTLGGESHAEFEAIPAWHPRSREYESNRLTAVDAQPAYRRQLLEAFARRLRDRAGLRWDPSVRGHPTSLRFLEKTPKNSLRIPLIRALFPDARFVFLFREPSGNVSSIMEAWRSGRFVTYPELPGWSGMPWSLLLPPGWRDLNGAPLERIAAFQWRAANEIALQDLTSLPGTDWCALSYEALTADPQAALDRLCGFIEVPAMVPAGGEPLPDSRYTLTPPHADKWRANQTAVESVLPELDATWQSLQVLSPAVHRGAS